MADLDFEYKLERMFAQAPAVPDAHGFALRVENRLNRNWAFRRWMISAVGVVGGLIAAGQLVGANVNDRMQGIGAAAWHDATRNFGALTPQIKALSYLSVGHEVIWMGGALALLAVALIATRSIEEL